MKASTSNMCMTCTERLTVSGDHTEDLSSRLKALHAEKRWVTLTSAAGRHEADVCRACVEKIASESDALKASNAENVILHAAIEEIADGECEESEATGGCSSTARCHICRAADALNDVDELAKNGATS